MQRLAVVLGVAAVVVGCGEPTDRAAPPTPAPGAIPRPAPAPAAEAPPVDRQVGPGLTALAPVRDGTLIVVPIVAEAPAHGPRFLTLDDGMRRGLVSVRELRDVDYGRLEVSNRSADTLCVMAGELVLGGHQDRTFGESLAVAPHHREGVRVMCVEPDRDHGPSRRLVSAGAMVHAELRRQVYQGTQSSVWDEVRGYNRVHDIDSATSTYRHAAARQRTGAPGEWRARVAAVLRALPERERIVGVALALEGRLLSVDVFATPALYQAMEATLLGAFVAQAADSTRELRAPRPAEIRALLATATTTACGRTALAPAPAAP